MGRIKGMATAAKYPVELKERAVAMVGELERKPGSGRGVIVRVAKQLVCIQRCCGTGYAKARRVGDLRVSGWWGRSR